ncbi:MAG: glycyl-radical enzyme activating protein [Spirochaetales bacterium]|nr:glycyl-radical enzyme activating protein [Spirochaetales bacterium]
MSTEDGPGLRTTVFMKGCSLKCCWCHNPESIQPGIQVQWYGVKCIACGLCTEVCENNAINLTPRGVEIDREKCGSCTRCVETCPSGAMTQIGTYREPEELAMELLKDRVYFEKSGGGITISGGEPVLQSDFVLELLKCLKKERIHTALDTCGAAASSSLEKLLPFTDLVLFDLKHADNDQHKLLTGQGNIQILKNIDLACRSDAEIWIRTPIIPGCTNSENNIYKLTLLIADVNKKAKHRGILKWELLTFNNLCADKYKRLGLEWKLEGTKLVDENQIVNLYNIADMTLAKMDPKKRIKVSWSGSTTKGVLNEQ